MSWQASSNVLVPFYICNESSGVAINGPLEKTLGLLWGVSLRPHLFAETNTAVLKSSGTGWLIVRWGALSYLKCPVIRSPLQEPSWQWRRRWRRKHKPKPGAWGSRELSYLPVSALNGVHAPPFRNCKIVHGKWSGICQGLSPEFTFEMERTIWEDLQVVCKEVRMVIKWRSTLWWCK